jgi:DNA-binding transcriptional MerR regulator
MLRIGPFATASSLSVKALRFYHDIGLLVPAVVDSATGYRSYSPAQLIDATVIRRLRDLDVPIDAIREVLDARDPEVTRKVLAQHGAALEARIAGLQEQADHLMAAVAEPSAHTGVYRRAEPARVILSIERMVSADEMPQFIEQAVLLLIDALTKSGAVADGGLSACFGTEFDDDGRMVEPFVPIAEPVLLPPDVRAGGVRVADLPATDVAVLDHRGGYDTLEDAYRELGVWVAANAEPSDLPVREYYLTTPFETDDWNALRTEVCWPVRERNTQSS